MFSFKKTSKQAKYASRRYSFVSTSEGAVSCKNHTKQVVNNKSTSVKKRNVVLRAENVSKFSSGLLLACRSVENMIRRSFQLSGSYDVIKSWDDLQAALLESKTPNIQGISCFKV